MGKLTYIGTPDDLTQEITVFGHKFQRGKAATLNASDDGYQKLLGNPTFTTDAGEVREAEENDDAAERKRITDELERRGVDYHARTSTKNLQAKLDELILADAKEG